jgi:hypothetical protein
MFEESRWISLKVLRTAAAQISEQWNETAEGPQPLPAVRTQISPQSGPEKNRGSGLESADMNAADTLKAARAAGIELALDGDDLALSAASAPPAAVLHALARHKAEIVALLRPGRDGWSAEDWQVYFDERVAEFDGGLPRAEAEARAFQCCVVEWLNQHPAPSPPGSCRWCGKSESASAVVLPFGTSPQIRNPVLSDPRAQWPNRGDSL